ncbi:MAG: undecaprenyldiphospho-muramoylpentapeptide beta-N-acetylglucosaminyltransferase [Lactobacillus sp.]|nr:undecaprenyldiphospho-muramoylpentapeptide beta-N-acetylglucosaminyltransferase [Lactobacillus sp.]
MPKTKTNTKTSKTRNSKKKAPLIVLTAGGTGGHVYPAESLAYELDKRGYQLALITDSRGKDNYKGKLGEIKNHAVLAGALVGKSKWFKIKSLFKTAIGTLQAMWILIKNRPACVVGFGGYASFPCCCAAILLRIKLVIHEQNSVMSRTNRFLSKHAALIATSFNKTSHLPNNKKIILTGMPVRKAITDIRDRTFPPSSDKFTILVLGGSQGAQIFSTVIPEAINLFNKSTQKKIKLIQQCRANDLDTAKTLYKEISSEIILEPFFSNMHELFAESSLIITRAGASSVAEVMAIGLPSILVPLPIAADNHQYYNSMEVTDAKGGIRVDQPDFTAKNLNSLIKDFMEDSKKLKTMSNNAKKAGITDAASRLANAIETEIL